MSRYPHSCPRSWHFYLTSPGIFLINHNVYTTFTVSVAVMLETAPRFLPAVGYNVVQPLVVPRGRIPDVVDRKTSMMFAVNTKSLHIL